MSRCGGSWHLHWGAADRGNVGDAGLAGWHNGNHNGGGGVVIGRAAGHGGTAAGDDHHLGAVCDVGSNRDMLNWNSGRGLDLDLSIGDLVDLMGGHGRVSHEGSEGE